MAKVLKWVVLVVGILVVCAIGALAVFFYFLNPKVKPAPALTAPQTPEAVARGRYLAESVAACMSCHSVGNQREPGDPTQPGMLGSGRDFGPMAGFPGRVRAPNLTPHGLSAWSDGEIVRAIREGVDRDGRTLFPMMPYGTYGNVLPDDDALAIVAYLRALPAVVMDPGPMEVDFPVSMFVRAAPRPVEKSPPPEPPAADPVARGEWLIAVAACGECHSGTEGGRPQPGLRLAGNDTPFAFDEHKVYAGNLTSDAATGIGGWSDDEILRVLDAGTGKDGKPIYIMPWPYYRGMTAEDKRAIVAALRKLPPVAHAVPAATKP